MVRGPLGPGGAALALLPGGLVSALSRFERGRAARKQRRRRLVLRSSEVKIGREVDAGEPYASLHRAHALPRTRDEQAGPLEEWRHVENLPFGPRNGNPDLKAKRNEKGVSEPQGATRSRRWRRRSDDTGRVGVERHID